MAAHIERTVFVGKVSTDLPYFQGDHIRIELRNFGGGLRKYLGRQRNTLRALLDMVAVQQLAWKKVNWHNLSHGTRAQLLRCERRQIPTSADSVSTYQAGVFRRVHKPDCLVDVGHQLRAFHTVFAES